jgi:hypothetical protein
MAKLLHAHQVFECFQCGTRKTCRLSAYTPAPSGLDYPTEEQAYNDGWRVAAAFVDSMQGIFVFTCGKAACRAIPTPTWCGVGDRRHELEPYRGSERWWERRQ